MNHETGESFERMSRTAARTLAQNGIALLARALNHCGRPDVAHRYKGAEQTRFHELASELVQLIEYGDIEANPAHRLHLLALEAGRDKAVQALIRRASQKTPIRSK